MTLHIRSPVTVEELAQRAADRQKSEDYRKSIMSAMGRIAVTLLKAQKILGLTKSEDKDAIPVDQMAEMYPSWYLLGCSLSGMPLKVVRKLEGPTGVGHLHFLTAPNPDDRCRALPYVRQSKFGGGPGKQRYGSVIVKPGSHIKGGDLDGEIDINGVVGAKLFDKKGYVAYCEGAGMQLQKNEQASDITRGYEDITLDAVGTIKGWQFLRNKNRTAEILYGIRNFIRNYHLGAGASEDLSDSEVEVEVSGDVLESELTEAEAEDIKADVSVDHDSADTQAVDAVS